MHGGISKHAIKIKTDALFENKHLKRNDLFSTIKRNNISDNTIAVFVHNLQSLSKHIDDIVSDDRIINLTLWYLQKHKPIIRFCLENNENIEIYQY